MKTLPQLFPNASASTLERNTPEQIVTRHAGARFYCYNCGGTYVRYPKTHQCLCRVYVSVDSVKGGKSGTANYGFMPFGN